MGVGPHLQESGITANTFEELAELMVASVQGRSNLVVVCGPITSGGTGDERMNFDVFNAVIEGIRRDHIPRELFDQRPFEYGLRDLAFRWYKTGKTGYCWPILHVCYESLFNTGAFGLGCFIPGYRTSTGAAWERDKLSSLGCATVELTHADVRTYLQRARTPGTQNPLFPQEYIDAVLGRVPQ